MSILHEKLKAIIAAIDNAFDFANPELVREKAETEFKQAVADEYKALAERVNALEDAFKQAGAIGVVTSNPPGIKLADGVSADLAVVAAQNFLNITPSASSATTAIDLAPVSAAVVADTFLGSAPPATDTALDTAIISAMSKSDEDGSAAPAATAE